jgi:hypothetical protein
MYMNDTSNMNDRNREIQIKVRLNQAELDALKKIAALQDIGKCEVLRGYIHQNAPR